jgi:hypothetical protein
MGFASRSFRVELRWHSVERQAGRLLVAMSIFASRTVGS